MTSSKLSHRRVELVPISKIRVVNPRSRNHKSHDDIVKNIRRIGLKRPITVTRRTLPDGEVSYDLICGQGRMEAFQILGQHEIPAFVTEASHEECLVLSLVENVARRTQHPIELIREIGKLRKRGNSDPQIAQMIGVTPSYINMLGKLLDKEEERLLTAVEAGFMTIETAIEISRSDSDVQGLLEIASKQGFKGKKLVTMRRLLERRLRDNKLFRGKSASAKAATKITPAALRRFYKEEVHKKHAMAKKAENVRDRVTYAVEAMKTLLCYREFRELVENEVDIPMPEIFRELVAESGATA